MEEAEASLREGVAYARRLQAKSFELRAATGLARALAATGRTDKGREVLAPVLDWFTEGQGTADLTAARSFLKGPNPQKP
jgi:predicted ATPase